MGPAAQWDSIYYQLVDFEQKNLKKYSCYESLQAVPLPMIVPAGKFSTHKDIDMPRDAKAPARRGRDLWPTPASG